AGLAGANDGEPRSVGHGQLAEDQRVHDGEDGGIGADAEGQGEDGDGGDERGGAQGAEGGAETGQQAGAGRGWANGSKTSRGGEGLPAGAQALQGKVLDRGRRAPHTWAMSASIPDPPALHDRALQDLSFIRRTMEGAASFTDVPGWGLVLLGVVALAAAPIAERQPTPERWLAVWVLTAVVAVLLGTVAMLRKMRRRVG